MVDVQIPGFNLNTRLPERTKGKNVAVLSQNTTNHNDPGFLSDDFPRNPPKLYVTAESDEFDALTLAAWRDEGFLVEYVPMGDGGEDYVRKLERMAKKKLDPCETFGIVAYGDAASFCLEHYHVLDNNEGMKLGLLVAYYPTRIPEPRGKFPSSISALVHLAGREVGVVSHSQMVGIQGKRRVTQRSVDAGLGAGRVNRLAYPSYTYTAEPGFAEHDLDEYERVSAELAWSRSLAAARKAFHRHVDMELELTLDENIQSKFITPNSQAVMSSYTTHKTPHVTFFPTLTGGVGAEELERFYSEYFLNSNPPSTRLTLISRTIGADRVVDEMHVGFKHTHEMAWILPGVAPTGKRVEVVVVSVVTVRGGKLYSEHVYWDQASVLVQVGLLDPKLLPQRARELGVEELPVVGREAARRLRRGMEDAEDGEADNELIPGWYEDDDEDGEEEDKREAKDKPQASKPSESGDAGGGVGGGGGGVAKGQGAQ